MIANAPTSMTPMVVAPVCGNWVMLSMFFTTAVGTAAFASALVTVVVRPGWSLPAMVTRPSSVILIVKLGLTKLK
ncbi:Uncharacterised protein [Bifidobacterium adolescentis]|nr:Uncharacterised protein [Bifidobacterium adolescentis]